MMKWKKYWGLIPFGVFFALTVSVWCIEYITDSQLRSVPKVVLFWFDLLSALLLILWVGCKILTLKWIRQFRGGQILKDIAFLIFCFFVVVSAGAGMFISAFLYQPEHVVERNGICMVASVNSFLQERVYYYEYKNQLFYGNQCIGFEDYGNGGGDPLKEGGKPKSWYFQDLEGNIIERGGVY